VRGVELREERRVESGESLDKTREDKTRRNKQTELKREKVKI